MSVLFCCCCRKHNVLSTKCECLFWLIGRLAIGVAFVILTNVNCCRLCSLIPAVAVLFAGPVQSPIPETDWWCSAVQHCETNGDFWNIIDLSFASYWLYPNDLNKWKVLKFYKYSLHVQITCPFINIYKFRTFSFVSNVCSAGKCNADGTEFMFVHSLYQRNWGRRFKHKTYKFYV